MTTTETIIYLLYIGAVLLPLIPGLFELRVAGDDDPLKIDAAYARDPRFLGKSMRAKVGPILSEVAGEERVPFLNRKNEFARVIDAFESIDRSRFDDVVLSRGRFRVGDHSTLLDVYAQGAVEVGAASRLRTLAADTGARFGSGTQVIRWIDVEGDCSIGNGSDLGQSVSASGRLILGSGVRFNRLFGHPISVGMAQRAELRGLAEAPIFAPGSQGRATAASYVAEAGRAVDGDIVAANNVDVGAMATIAGSIKAGGGVTLRENARVFGNVVARGTVTLERDASVLGHIFGEGDVVLHPGALVGGRHAPRTVHASKTARIAQDACVYGWVIAERGGITMDQPDAYKDE